MKNITFYLLTLCCLLFPSACFGSGETDSTTTPVNNPSALIRVADPTVVVWQGKYYLTGTSGDSSKGFTLLESTDMTHWTTAGQALTKGDQTFGTKGFWAPQIVKWGDNKWVMAYTANEQVAIAWADKLSGPYRQTTVGAWDDTEKNIDPFIFRDDDGQCYLYHVRFNNGNYIWKPSLDIAKPDTILGRPVYTSVYMPEVASGNKAVLFGDYKYYYVADRQARTFKRLNELYARTDQVGFITTQRVDGKLILPEAVKALVIGGSSAAKASTTTKTS